MGLRPWIVGALAGVGTALVGVAALGLGLWAAVEARLDVIAEEAKEAVVARAQAGLRTEAEAAVAASEPARDAKIEKAVKVAVGKEAGLGQALIAALGDDPALRAAVAEAAVSEKSLYASLIKAAGAVVPDAAAPLGSRRAALSLLGLLDAEQASAAAAALLRDPGVDPTLIVAALEVYAPNADEKPGPVAAAALAAIARADAQPPPGLMAAGREFFARFGPDVPTEITEWFAEQPGAPGADAAAEAALAMKDAAFVGALADWTSHDKAPLRALAWRRLAALSPTADYDEKSRRAWLAKLIKGAESNASAPPQSAPVSIVLLDEVVAALADSDAARLMRLRDDLRLRDAPALAAILARLFDAGGLRAGPLDDARRSFPDIAALRAALIASRKSADGRDGRALQRVALARVMRLTTGPTDLAALIEPRLAERQGDAAPDEAAALALGSWILRLAEEAPARPSDAAKAIAPTLAALAKTAKPLAEPEIRGALKALAQSSADAVAPAMLAAAPDLFAAGENADEAHEAAVIFGRALGAALEAEVDAAAAATDAMRQASAAAVMSKGRRGRFEAWLMTAGALALAEVSSDADAADSLAALAEVAADSPWPSFRTAALDLLLVAAPGARDRDVSMRLALELADLPRAAAAALDPDADRRPGERERARKLERALDREFAWRLRLKDVKATLVRDTETDADALDPDLDGPERWAKIDARPGELLDISAAAAALLVADAEGRPLGGCAALSGRVQLFVEAPTEAATLYLRMTPRSGEAGASRLAPAQQLDLASADRRARAAVLALDARRLARLESGETAWLAVDIAEPGDYALEADDLRAAADPALAVYDARALDPLAENSGASSRASRLVFRADEAARYYARLDEQGVGGSLAISMRKLPPAKMLAAAERSRPLELVLGEALYLDSADAAEGWATVTASQAGRLIVETYDLALDADTTLAVYRAGAGEPLAENDDAGDGFASRLDVAVEAGARYEVLIGELSAGGRLALRATLRPD